jgi:hypothetical protein
MKSYAVLLLLLLASCTAPALDGTPVPGSNDCSLPQKPILTVDGETAFAYIPLQGCGTYTYRTWAENVTELAESLPNAGRRYVISFYLTPAKSCTAEACPFIAKIPIQTADLKDKDWIMRTDAVSGSSVVSQNALFAKEDWQSFCRADADCMRRPTCCDCGLGTWVNKQFSEPRECRPGEPLCRCALQDAKGVCENNRCVGTPA